MNRINKQSIVNNVELQKQINQKSHKQRNEFAKLLESKVNSLDKELRFSKHASERLEQRGIHLEEADVEKISKAIDMAREKGISNSLIVTDKAVYIANVKSKTIITAMESMQDRVFTNVDGVINI